MKDAMQDGVPVLGYLVWGCIDLVSSGTGEMKKRYGLVYVDKDDAGNGSYDRSVKKSYHWYKRVIQTNGEELRQMKICAYEVRDDERESFLAIAHQTGVEVSLHAEVPSKETAELAHGCEGVTILGQGDINAALLDRWADMGVKYLSTRTIGFNHIDLDHAAARGIQVCNASYPPSGVADFTLMLMLMCLRNYKQALWRGQVNDFSLMGLEGRELGDLTVGVMGTGRIGQAVIQRLRGFGCKILAFDPYPSEKVREYAEYVNMDELYARSDVITLHMPLIDSTHHMINKESLSKMKDGVVIINCARGELADVDALIKGIERGKIGALGLDVVEFEEGITHVDHRIDILSNRHMAYLRQFRNVVMTPHMAFYTDTAVYSMVRYGVQGLVEMQQTGTCPTELKGARK